MGPLQQVAWCLLVSLPIFGFLVRHRQKTPQPSSVKAHAKEVNDSLDQPNDQSGIPKMQVLFFHGIPYDDFSDIHLNTWCHKNGFLWPQTWLQEKFPGVHVFFVKYDSALVNANIRMNNVGENLVSDLLQANIGQVPSCPVVLVGHCIGGLIIKELCWKAHEELHSTLDLTNTRAKKIATFLESVKGVFFYSTPHHGIREIARASHVMRGALFKFFETLSIDTAVLNGNFNKLCKIYSQWKIEGVGESLLVESGVFQNTLVVEEASAREGVQVFNILRENHFSVCKPKEQISGGFYHLINLLQSVAEEEITRQAKSEEENLPQNLQRLPKSYVGMEDVLAKLIARLEEVVTLGLTGMGGLGKTTLAKAIFNAVACKYEYTCFISEVKLIAGDLRTLRNEAWKYVYRNGTKVEGEENWSKLRKNDIFVVFDDISRDQDVEFLLDLADCSSAGSRFVATSREKVVFNRLDDTSCHVYDVSGLDDDSAHQLFMSYAFPRKEIPSPQLGSLMTEIVKKCEGLPLTLEVLGQWLKGERKEDIWRQTLASLDEAEHVQNFDNRLWSKLMPSIHGLAENELQMFLDASTFFYAFDRHRSEYWTLLEAQAAWREAYGVEEKLLWKTLVDRSLVYHVEEDEKIKIHEQLRSLGRKLASESEKGRVWEVSTATKRLLSANESDKKDMHALWIPKLSPNDAETIAADANLEEDVFVDGELSTSKLGFQKLEKLRYLDIEDLEINCFPSGLVALQFNGSRIPNLSHLKRLVVLKVENVDVASLANSIGQLSALRILNLAELNGGTIPEEIGNLSKLEVLHIRHCSKLETLPESLGQLSSLNYLLISHCGKLESLPESLGLLRTLAHLEIHACWVLKSLPLTFGQLSALRRLGIGFCPLKGLPESMGNLLFLTHLKLAYCESLQSLPESLGQLVMLEYLEIYQLQELERLPDSLAQLVTLRHLKIIQASSLEVIPDWIQNLPSLHTLELSELPCVRELPPWLGVTGVRTRKVFRREDGLWSWTHHSTVTPRQVVDEIHRIAMDKVSKSDNEGALAHIEIDSLGIPVDGSLLTEKGVIKRNMGDLEGALEDLTAAIEYFSRAEGGQHHIYDCWKHRGYVKFLTGDMEGAEHDGTMALKLQSVYQGNLFPAYRQVLGGEFVQYMHFRLNGLQEIRHQHDQQMSSLHSDVLEKVKALNYQGAIRNLKDITVTLLSYRKQGFFLQERGILKRLAGDLGGALEDLKAAQGILWSNEVLVAPVFKHVGYVKFLLGDLNGARTDAQTYLYLRTKETEEKNIDDSETETKDLETDDNEFGKDDCLGSLPVKFLEFNLT